MSSTLRRSTLSKMIEDSLPYLVNYFGCINGSRNVYMNFALLLICLWYMVCKRITLKVLKQFSLLHKLEIVGIRLIFWSVAYDFLIACMDEKQTSSEGLKLKFGWQSCSNHRLIFGKKSDSFPQLEKSLYEFDFSNFFLLVFKNLYVYLKFTLRNGVKVKMRLH